MRRRRIYSAMTVLWLSSATATGIDLADFDTDTMQAVDDASKELESGLAARESQAAIANAEFIRDSLKWAEGYFANKGNVGDAVQWARQGWGYAADIARTVGEGNFEAASEAYDSLRRTCKSCHDAYKPPSL
jgi:hypothetical protein